MYLTSLSDTTFSLIDAFCFLATSLTVSSFFFLDLATGTSMTSALEAFLDFLSFLDFLFFFPEAMASRFSLIEFSS
jgi:hypothetical protein